MRQLSIFFLNIHFILPLKLICSTLLLARIFADRYSQQHDPLLVSYAVLPGEKALKFGYDVTRHTDY